MSSEIYPPDWRPIEISDIPSVEEFKALTLSWLSQGITNSDAMRDAFRRERKLIIEQVDGNWNNSASGKFINQHAWSLEELVKFGQIEKVSNKEYQLATATPASQAPPPQTVHSAISPIDRVRLRKAAQDEGFGIDRGESDGWMVFDSLHAPASLRLTSRPSGYVAATNHLGVAADLATRWTVWDGTPPTGFTAFVVTDTAPLHQLVREMWRLAQALPSGPLSDFESKTRTLPKSTEAERLVVQRVGQDIFRDALMKYWGEQCAVLGIRDPRLLRASHIKPWAECTSDAERLDVYNGLLLAAHLDAAFDAFLISFEDVGRILISPSLSDADRVALGIHADLRLTKIAPAHLPQLAWHRDRLVQN